MSLTPLAANPRAWMRSRPAASNRLRTSGLAGRGMSPIADDRSVIIPASPDTANVAIDECHHFVLTHSHDGVSADSWIAAIPFRSSGEHDDIAADQRGFTARTGMEPLAIATDRVRHHGCLRTVAGRDPDRAR